MRAGAITTTLAILTLAVGARAQGVESPPVTSFRADSSMPSVKVPEFVITGKAQIALPKAAKPLVQIDSSYFQGKHLRGVDAGLPLEMSIGNQFKESGNPANGLYFKLSAGHYSTIDYLVSGLSTIGGFNLAGSVSGDYTSGFIPNTLRRDFSILAGVSKDINVDDGMKSSNSLTVGYSRSGYSLYGSPTPVLQRTTVDTKFGLSSDMYLGEFPLAVGLDLDRFSLADVWDNTLSSLALNGSSQFELGSGWVGLNARLMLADHTLGPSAIYPAGPPPISPASLNLNRSLYDIVVGAAYGNSLFAGRLSFSAGLTYFQYRDDSVSTAAKLYPDARLNYRFSESVSLFAGFNASLHEAKLSGFLATDPYVEGAVALVNTQNEMNFFVGGILTANREFSFTPQFSYQQARYYPVYLSYRDPLSTGSTSYLSFDPKASIMTLSLRTDFRLEAFSAELSLEYQKGKLDTVSSIPNLPPFNARLEGRYDITPQLSVNGSILFLSSRYADLALADKLDPVGLMDFRLSYDFQISKLPVRLFLGGKNIFNARYFIWQGYQEFPLTLYIGISSRIL